MSNKCDICGEEFSNGRVKSNHVKWKHSTKEKIKQCNEKISKKATERQEAIFGEKKKIEIKCPVCGKYFFTFIKNFNGEQIPFIKNGKSYFYKNNFCSRSCANSIGGKINKIKNPWTEERKNKVSNTTKRLWENKEYAEKVLKSARMMYSSKREREIVDYFKKNFPEDKWVFGGLGTYKNEFLSCDLYSRKLKIVFEYDGVWHFKDIYGRLEKKKMKDSLLEDYCREKGFRVIRVDEDENLDLKEIEFLIYNREEPLLKIGKRY